MLAAIMGPSASYDCVCDLRVGDVQLDRRPERQTRRRLRGSGRSPSETAAHTRHRGAEGRLQSEYRCHPPLRRPLRGAAVGNAHIRSGGAARELRPALRRPAGQCRSRRYRTFRYRRPFAAAGHTRKWCRPLWSTATRIATSQAPPASVAERPAKSRKHAGAYFFADALARRICAAWSCAWAP